MAPAVQISEPPRPGEKSSKMEHKRWRSEPDRRRDMVQPFSYEYQFEEGRLAGLTELHPDDYIQAHARTMSADRTARSPKLSNSPRPVVESRGSASTQGSQGSSAPPPSPRKGDALKRALTLHGLKRRASSEVKKTPPSSPYSRPEIEKLAASFGPHGPQSISSPKPQLPEPKPYGMFEQPRVAPRPPSRDMPKLSPRPEPSPQLSGSFPRPEPSPRPEVTMGTERSPGLRAHAFRPLQVMNSSHDALLPPKKLPTPPRSPMTVNTIPIKVIPDAEPASLPRVDRAVKPEKTEKRPPPLRKKTSKFIEHIEHKEKLSPRVHDKEAEVIPPVPPMVLTAGEFKLSVHGAMLQTPPPDIINFPSKKESMISPDSPTIGYVPDLPWTPREEYSRETESTPKISITPPRSPPLHNNFPSSISTLKRSSSLMKALPAPPGQTLGRSSTTKSRPKPLMSDVCMAQIKRQPILTSGIVAQGHARMISC